MITRYVQAYGQVERREEHQTLSVFQRRRAQKAFWSFRYFNVDVLRKHFGNRLVWILLGLGHT
jgi:hypothetical protein